MKTFQILILSLLLFSCQKLESVDIKEKADSPLNEYCIGVDVAAVKVKQTMEIFAVNTKGIDREIASIETINNITKSSVASPFYLFNFKDNKGYALISSDLRDSNITYMISEEGNLSVDDLLDDKSPLSFLMKCIANYQNYLIGNYNGESVNITKADSYDCVYTDYVYASYGPLLSTKWHQKHPFTAYRVERDTLDSLHDYVMGCTPVAFAQIARYYNFPSGCNNYQFNWPIINQVNTKNDAENIPDGAYEVSKLMYALSLEFETLYRFDADNSAIEIGITDNQKMVRAIRRLGYTCSGLTDYSYQQVLSSISNNRPVLTFGGQSDPTATGHAWVIDGYKNILTEVRTYDSRGNQVEDTFNEDFNYDIYRQYWHCNMGWGNGCNGLYIFCEQMTDFFDDNFMLEYDNIFNISCLEYSDNSQDSYFTLPYFDYSYYVQNVFVSL